MGPPKRIVKKLSRNHLILIIAAIALTSFLALYHYKAWIGYNLLPQGYGFLYAGKVEKAFTQINPSLHDPLGFIGEGKLDNNAYCDYSSKSGLGCSSSMYATRTFPGTQTSAYLGWLDGITADLNRNGWKLDQSYASINGSQGSSAQPEMLRSAKYFSLPYSKEIDGIECSVNLGRYTDETLAGEPFTASISMYCNKTSYYFRNT